MNQADLDVILKGFKDGTVLLDIAHDAWLKRGIAIKKESKTDAILIPALGKHGKLEPVEKAVVIEIGDHVAIRLPKFGEYTDDKTGELKVHGGNFVLQLLDPRSKNKNGTPRYFMQGYYTAPAVAYLLDSFNAMGIMDAQGFKKAQLKVWNHLPFCKHHRDASKKDSDVKCLKDNAGYDKLDLHWKAESK